MRATTWSGVTLRLPGPKKARYVRATLKGKALTVEAWAEGGKPRVSRTTAQDAFAAERELTKVAQKRLLEGYLLLRDPAEAEPGELVFAARPPGAGSGTNFDVDPAGKRMFLVAGRGDQKATSAVIDLATGVSTRRPVPADSPGRQLFVHAALISADGARGYYALNDTLREQDLATGEERDLSSFDEYRENINPHCVFPDMDAAHRWLLCVSPGGLVVLDAASGKRLCQVRPGTKMAECRAIGFSPSGKTFAAYVVSRFLVYGSGHQDAVEDKTNEVHLYRVEDGKLLARVPSAEKLDQVAPAFDDDGVWVTRDYHRGPYLLDPKGKERLALGQRDAYSACWAYSADGALLAVGDSSGEVRLLETKRWRQVGAVPTTIYRPGRLLFSGDGRVLYIGGDGMVEGRALPR